MKNSGFQRRAFIEKLSYSALALPAMWASATALSEPVITVKELAEEKKLLEKNQKQQAEMKVLPPAKA